MRRYLHVPQVAAVMGPCVAGGAAGSRLSYGAVQALTSVIIVVDSTRTTNLNMAQIADYVAMVGLAHIRLDADTGTASTILSLFRDADLRPQELSVWDQSFLRSLYTTSQSSVLQVNVIKGRMFDQIVRGVVVTRDVDSRRAGVGADGDRGNHRIAATAKGPEPTGNVAVTVLVAVAITDTLFEPEFVM